MTENKSFIQLLDFLGPLYHGWFGLQNETLFITEMPYLQEALKKHMAIIQFHNGTIIENQVKAEDLKNIGNYTIIYQQDYLNQLAQTPLPFTKIILKYSTGWNKQPSKWYECSRSRLLKQKSILPTLSSCSYLTVVKPFLEYQLSATEKGQPLTVMDVLFASRGLMFDESRSIDEGFHLISDNTNELVLEPDIDNWT